MTNKPPVKPDLDKIRQRVNAATSESWEDNVVVMDSMDQIRIDSDNALNDAEFIGCIREDAPALLAYIEWLEDQNESLHDTIEVAADALIDGWLHVQATKDIKPTYQAAQDKLDEEAQC